MKYLLKVMANGRRRQKIVETRSFPAFKGVKTDSGRLAKVQRKAKPLGIKVLSFKRIKPKR